MVLPRLLHPINITIEQTDEANTVYDEDTREPVQQSTRRVTAVIQGQVQWGFSNNYTSQPQGAQETSDGYVLFRYRDLEAQGITLKREDRISKMGHLDVDVYISKLMPMGHYGDQNGATMVRAYFQDRQPSKQTPG